MLWAFWHLSCQVLLLFPLFLLLLDAHCVCVIPFVVASWVLYSFFFFFPAFVLFAF